MFLQQIVLILSCGWPVYLIEPSKWFYQILEKSTNLTILGYESYTWVYKTSITGYIRRVWRYQRGNHNPYNEEEQTTQWPKEKVPKNKQRSTKCTHKTKDRITWTPLKTGGELGCSGRVAVPASLVTPVIAQIQIIRWLQKDIDRRQISR